MFLHRLTKHTTLATIFFLLIITPIAFLFAYLDSFKLALSGDDWLILYTIWHLFDISNSLSYWDPKTYLCTYCPPYGYLSIIKYYWGYDPFYYYLISSISRYIAAISIFISIYLISKNKFASLLSAFLFLISYIGIQSTDWVFNFYHYIGIIFGMSFLASYFYSYKNPNIFSYALFTVLFSFSLISSPNRMHGLLPLVFITELIWMFIYTKHFSYKKLLIRISLLLIAYKIVFSGTGYGSTEYNLTMVASGINIGKELLEKGNYIFLTNPFITIGNYILPDKLYATIPFEQIKFFGLQPYNFRTYLLPINILLTFICCVFLYWNNVKKSMVFLFIISSFGLMICNQFIYKAQSSFYTLNHLLYNQISLLALIFSLLLFIQTRKKYPLLSQLMLIGYGWMLTFTIFPLLIAPYLMLGSSMRYSLQQSIGLSIWISSIFSLSILASSRINLSTRYIRLTVIAICILAITTIHIFSSKDYLSNAANHRGISINKHWDLIKSEIPMISKSQQSLFYIKSNDALTLEESFRFPFAARTAMLYEITDQTINPIIRTNYEDVVKLINDPKEISKEGKKPTIINIENIYAFELKDNQMINITTNIRNELSKLQISRF